MNSGSSCTSCGRSRKYFLERNLFFLCFRFLPFYHHHHLVELSLSCISEREIWLEASLPLTIIHRSSIVMLMNFNVFKTVIQIFFFSFHPSTSSWLYLNLNYCWHDCNGFCLQIVCDSYWCLPPYAEQTSVTECNKKKEKRKNARGIAMHRW